MIVGAVAVFEDHGSTQAPRKVRRVGPAGVREHGMQQWVRQEPWEESCVIAG
jgi:hypothetical protein